MSGGSLDGIRIIDLTSVVIGPICTRRLADQGADVIKVEPPSGDLLRTLAKGGRNPGMPGKFLNFNRNKRSICLDLKKPAGADAVRRLAKTADVFVSNVRPSALARAGLDWDPLHALNPRLIYCGIVAFGEGGRYYNQPAYDPIVQSLSGIAGTFERAHGKPIFVPMVMSDHVTGLIAAQCIGFALYRREKTGVGETIEVPMLENMASFVMSEHMGGETFIPAAGPSGDNRLVSPDYRPQPTKDGYITISPNTDAQAFAFFDAIGRPELKTDPRFDSPASRTAHAHDYFEVRAKGLAQRTTDEWMKLFAELDIPAARYNTIDDLFDDPHLNDVNFFREVDHPSEGRIRTTKVPNAFGGGGRDGELTAPLKGQHTNEVLTETGYNKTEIEDMLSEGSAFEGD